jgi:hypothetical protein
VCRCRTWETELISMHPAYRIPAERERCTRFTAYHLFDRVCYRQVDTAQETRTQARFQKGKVVSLGLGSMSRGIQWLLPLFRPRVRELRRLSPEFYEFYRDFVSKLGNRKRISDPWFGKDIFVLSDQLRKHLVNHVPVHYGNRI